MNSLINAKNYIATIAEYYKVKTLKGLFPFIFSCVLI